jgi:hypothetical protein
LPSLAQPCIVILKDDFLPERVSMMASVGRTMSLPISNTAT